MAIEICNDKDIALELELEEPLNDIITDECTSAIFECKLRDDSLRGNSYRWYKDGKFIKSGCNAKISSDDLWYRLEITSVILEDQGVYCIIVKNDNNIIFISYANLYVKPVKNTCNNHNEVIYMNPSTNNILVQKHLLCSRVLVGSTIELEAIFNEDAIEEYRWYKGDRQILQDVRMIMLNDKNTTTLSILYARETDSGIYHVISKTKYGMASSFATVIVINTNLNTLNKCETVPRILDPLLDDNETNEGEELRLICKASINNNTIIQWSKNGKNIQCDFFDKKNNILQEIFNNEYICLRIMHTSLADTGEYTVTMCDDITGLMDTSSCYVTVNKSPQSNVTPVKLKKCLEPVITCYGSTVLFTCGFDLRDTRYYYVVWYIGHYRVERSNHRFNVFCRDGNFFLFIKQVDPGMAGEIICELHRSLPNRKSILINKTTASFTIVPYKILNEEIKLLNVLPKFSIYNHRQSRTIVPIRSEKTNENGLSKTGTITGNGIDNHDKMRKNFLQVTYCSFEDDFFYLDIHSTNQIKYLVISEHIGDKDFGEDKHKKSVLVEWYSTSPKERTNLWYAIELSQANDKYFKVGETSLPMFKIKEPPAEQLMSFRINPVEALNENSETTVSISPATRESILSAKNIDTRSMEEFISQYTKTGDMIGCGAFGSVVLVRDENDEYYAAKILKTRTQKKRDTAYREYQIMRNLKHSKLVELIDTFVAKEAFVLVMDYLWGGELFDRIVEEEHIKEVDVVPYVKQICEALQYLHNLKIAHLDLKPENIICLSPNSRQVKIIDFGLARVLDDGHETRAIYGTKDYVAPEVLNFEQLTLACDMWSLGVVTYMLLSGVMPFSGETWVERSANITKANYNYNETAFKEISDLAKDFVDHLLLLHPEKRMNSSTALNHQWIVEGPPRGVKAGHMKRTRENLKSYLANYRARWQRAGNVMIAAHRLRMHAGNHRVTSHETDQPIHGS